MNSTRVSQRSGASVGTMVHATRRETTRGAAFQHGQGSRVDSGDHAKAHLMSYTAGTMGDSLRCLHSESKVI